MRHNSSKYGIPRLFRRFLFNMAYKSCILSPKTRGLLYKFGGINIGRNVYIGREVLMDEVYPQGIHIGDNVFITQGTKIITHFYDKDRGFYFGDVTIGDDCFIGMNVLITKPLSIGNDCVVGMGTVVTKDIPSGSTVVGNPGRIIKHDKVKI